MKRIVGGVVAAAAIVVLLVGVPIALIQVGRYPVLRGWPTWQQIQATVLVPDDGRLILIVLTLLGWAAWLYLAAGFVVELIARLRHVPTPRLPGFALPQLAARTLIGAVILLFAGMTIHPSPAAAEPLPTNPHTSHAAPARVVTPQGPHQTRESTQGSRYTVKDGDTLAEIAQKRLGDADRWPDIYQASKHLRMPDGHRFSDPDLIQPGQHLIIPRPEAASTSHRYTVKDGDTLAEIAQKRLGDADRWPEIYQASKHLRMPDGHRFSDPDLIQPGQHLIIPGSADKPAKATKTSRSTTVPNTDQQRPRVQVVPPVVASSPTPAPTTAETAPHVTDAAVQDQAPVWSTSLGVGTVLAAGVIGLVAWRRRLQHRRGPIGGHVPLPTDDDALAEQQLRAAADPLAIETVDQALRGLARDCAAAGQPLPVVRAARLTAGQFEVYLDEPATLPAPWTGTADAAVWRFEADHQPDLDTEDLHTIPAPYPSLVTIGKDTEDETGLIFLDLEYLGSLGLTGPRQLTRQAVAALAIELASSPWADDLTVTIVGDYADLEGTLRSGRIVYVPTLEKLLDRLEARAATDRDALAAADAELATARVTGAAPDATFPEIVLVASPLTTRQRGRLTRLVTTLPRVAIAAVTTDDDPIGDWHLTINGPAAGMLQPIGLAVTPQMITPDTYDRILSVIHIATHEEATLDEQPVAAHDVDEGGLDLPETLVDQAETAAAQPATTIDDPSLERVPAAVEPEPTAHDDAGETSEAAGSTDLPSEDSVMPVPDLSQDVAEVVEVDQADFQSAQGDPVVADDEVVDEDPTAVSAEVLAAPALEVVEPEPKLPPPYVRVLGPTPQLENARGEADMNGRRDVSLEAIVYMALHPGATGPSLDVALWPDSTNPASTRAPALSRARRWLGTDPDGNPYLASHTYRLSKAVTTDWAEFQQLTRAGVDKTSTSGLERALELVQGRPFGGVRTQSRNPRYTWAEPARQRMIEAITTVSYELAQRRWLRSDWIGVEAALARGIQVEPALEHLWRLRIRAAVKRGDAGIVQESITRMTHLAAKLGVEIDPETEELLKAVRHTRLLEEARS